MKTTKEWFSVDKKGLRELQECKPKTFILRELIQNALDENIKEFSINISKEKKRIRMEIRDDSPE
jgi:hypothetical protein